MDINQILLKLAFSVVVGALIGLEREKKKQFHALNGGIGIRTDILISLFGATSILMSQIFSPYVFYISFICILIIGCTSYIFNKIQTKNENNLKTILSSILVFLLGALTMLGQFQIAIVIAIIVTFVLSIQYVLHKTIESISYNEIIDGIKFLIIAFVVLPFLPNQSYDKQIIDFFQPTLTQHEISVPAPAPTASPAVVKLNKPEQTSNLIPNNSDIINPYNIWLLIVIISGLDFMGYIMVKLFGQHRGYGITGMIGGFYSSTLTSLTLSHISKKHPKIKYPFIAGILLACGTSFIKMFILIRTLNSQLFFIVLPTMLVMFGYLLVNGAFFQWYAKKMEPKSSKTATSALMKLSSPLHMGSAFKIASIVIITMICANLILHYANLNFYFILAGLMAFLAADDPIIISTAGIAGTTFSYGIAKEIIIGVIFINTIQKIATVYFFGNRQLFKPLAFAMAGLFLVTTLAFLYL